MKGRESVCEEEIEEEKENDTPSPFFLNLNIHFRIG